MEYLTPNYHALYDFDDYVSRLATEEQYNAFERSMEKAVIYKATTPKAVYAYPYPYGSYLPVNKYSGLSIYIPQEALPKLMSGTRILSGIKRSINHLLSNAFREECEEIVRYSLLLQQQL